jgi:hypothetical protein
MRGPASVGCQMPAIPVQPEGQTTCTRWMMVFSVVAAGPVKWTPARFKSGRIRL